MGMLHSDEKNKDTGSDVKGLTRFTSHHEGLVTDVGAQTLQEIPFVKKYLNAQIYLLDLKELKKLGAETVNYDKTLETVKKKLVF